MKKKPIIMLLLAFALVLTLGQSVWAFSDTSKEPNARQIAELKRLGILTGQTDGNFVPKGMLTNAEGISLIVKGLGLNMDHINHIKEPKATDYYTNLKDDAWYADAFITAFYNDLELPKDIKPNTPMTREQFAHYLFQGMMTKGDYAFIELYIMIEDEQDVDPNYMNSIQKLLITKIAELDQDNKFNPQKTITRGEAAGWLYGAIDFINTVEPLPGEEPIEPVPFPLYDLDYSVKAVNKDVNEVTVTATGPHPGYGMRISNISFEENVATIHVEPILPDPTMMYPQVIVELAETTYVSSEYKIELAKVTPAESGGNSPVTKVIE